MSAPSLELGPVLVMLIKLRDFDGKGDYIRIELRYNLYPVAWTEGLECFQSGGGMW